MPLEHRKQDVAPFKRWCRRVLRSIGMAGIVACSALAIGVLGYHYMGELGWVDSLLEASMILGGMGPVAPMKNDAVKIFASIYALMSGLVLIGTTGILLGPWVHRLLHKFYQDTDSGAAPKKRKAG